VQLEDTINGIRPSVVQVTYTIFDLSTSRLKELGLKAGSTYSRPVGTGFIVTPDAHVITAKHVVDGIDEFRTKVPEGRHHVGVGLAYANTDDPRVSSRGTFNIVGFELLASDARHDLALLKLRRNPFAGEVESGIVVDNQPVIPLFGIAPPFRVERPRDGLSVAVSGYPLGEPVMITTAGTIASSWPVDVKDVPVPGAPGDSRADIADSYLADLRVNPGNSGGPAYAVEDGGVIGVCVATRLTSVVDPAARPVPLRTSAGLAVIVPARYAVELLETNGVEWPLSEG
jgi:S1-C subfamily serine protease